ncbi:MAG: flagellar basal body L-ring protein FlgH [Acidobacteria bacterium]|nr:flagellar basal body L-ring protein FlgH [Acidobacteriota bacterium]
MTETGIPQRAGADTALKQTALPRTAPRFLIAAVLLASIAAAAPLGGQTSDEKLNEYIRRTGRAAEAGKASPGSLFLNSSYLAETARDPKAATVGDLITIQVIEQASALSSGTVSSSRASSNNHSITSFFGGLNTAGALANLASSGGDSALDGQGSTGRTTSVTTRITGHVTHVMPNGNLIIEGVREIVVNAERQEIWLRGAVRPVDLRPDNSITSDRIAMLELRVNGKGVVNDAIRRPNFLYRLIKKILPF